MRGLRARWYEVAGRAESVTCLALAVAVLCIPLHAAADEPVPSADREPAVVTVGIAGLGSFQPGGYESPNSPYLSANLGGFRPGARMWLERRRAGQPVVALEIGTTLSFEAVQSGRFVRPSPSAECPEFGFCTATGRHRDTLLSLLVGGRTGAVVLKAGPTVVFGKTAQGDARYDDAAGHFALTAGFDGVVPVGKRLDLVPGGRYSYVFRGPDRDFVGIGRHVLRVSLGLGLHAPPR
jgi:hypothetical protein